MTLTIELTPEQEARLERAARAQGKPAAQIVSELIARLPEDAPPSDAVRTLRGYGRYAYVPTSSEDFARRKQEEIAHEEERAARRQQVKT